MLFGKMSLGEVFVFMKENNLSFFGKCAIGKIFNLPDCMGMQMIIANDYEFSQKRCYHGHGRFVTTLCAYLNNVLLRDFQEVSGLFSIGRDARIYIPSTIWHRDDLRDRIIIVRRCKIIGKVRIQPNFNSNCKYESRTTAVTGFRSGSSREKITEARLIAEKMFDRFITHFSNMGIMSPHETTFHIGLNSFNRISIRPDFLNVRLFFGHEWCDNGCGSENLPSVFTSPGRRDKFTLAIAGKSLETFLDDIDSNLFSTKFNTGQYHGKVLSAP